MEIFSGFKKKLYREKVTVQKDKKATIKLDYENITRQNMENSG